MPFAPYMNELSRLLALGTDPNHFSKTPLYIAAKFDEIEAVRVMHSINGIKVNFGTLRRTTLPVKRNVLIVHPSDSRSSKSVIGSRSSGAASPQRMAGLEVFCLERR